MAIKTKSSRTVRSKSAYSFRRGLTAFVDGLAFADGLGQIASSIDERDLRYKMRPIRIKVGANFSRIVSREIAADARLRHRYLNAVGKQERSLAKPVKKRMVTILVASDGSCYAGQEYEVDQD